MGPAQQKVQAVRLAADDGNAGAAQGARRVVDLEGRVARTATGAERGGERLVEQVKAPLRRGGWRVLAAHPPRVTPQSLILNDVAVVLQAAEPNDVLDDLS